ncbi:unnamed protein product [Larinioides sclopetarius]|uniref:Uncharacterized protein n=1 Tax=Larinioides sclopetarius TaxID=280406 RepID=A0AAV2A3V8_9ARAC
MAAEGSSRIQKSYEGHKYSAKRFAYDVLCITLSKCGFPETLLQVEVDKENDYPNRNDVLTVYAGVIVIALDSRDKWKRIFEYKQKSSMLNDMQKVEEFLAKIAFFPKLTDHNPDNKIRRSLAFCSELILFLHSNNIKVNFQKLLDTWSTCFHEKIAVDEDPDTLLEALFFEDDFIIDYLRLVDCFIQEIAKPYGMIDNVSEKFRDFSEEVEKLDKEPISSNKQLMLKLRLTGDIIDRLLNDMPHNLIHRIPEEAVSYLSELFERELTLPGNCNSPEQPQC